MESAKKLLELDKTKTINEIMYNSGYMDAKAFREVFKKIVGMSPLKYRESHRLHYA
jgi:YesN/AraC family two-component response regulator